MGIDCSLCVVARAICNRRLSDAERRGKGDENEEGRRTGAECFQPQLESVELQLCAGNYSLHVRGSSHGMSGDGRVVTLKLWDRLGEPSSLKSAAGPLPLFARGSECKSQTHDASSAALSGDDISRL